LKWGASSYETAPATCPAPFIAAPDAPKKLHMLQRGSISLTTPFDQYPASSQQLPCQIDSATRPLALRLAESIPASSVIGVTA
jgi:hypothetical protein